MATLDKTALAAYTELLGQTMGTSVMPSKPCQDCEKWVPIFAALRCHSCFAEKGERDGLPTEQMPKRCGADACEGFAVKRGLCDRHYRRFHDHGTTEMIRAVDPHRKHPEYANWLHRRTHGLLCERWQNFWAFLEDVGERPSQRHRLQRLDETALLGPGNFEWQPPKLAEMFDANTKEGRLAYQRARRAATPQWWVGSGLKRFYGLTREQYDALLAIQGGGCAVCGVTQDVAEDGSTQMLAVDHNHGTGEIRGLLCRAHNLVLGHAQDDATALRKAADYLDQDRHTGLFIPAGEIEPKERAAAMPAIGAACAAEGCDLAVKAQGFCPTHYARWRRTGSAELAPRKMRLACKEEGCGRPSVAHGVCRNHYAKLYNSGAVGKRAALVADAVEPAQACSHDGCTHSAWARGFCPTHYKRWQRHGSAVVVHDTHGRLRPPDDLTTT